MVAALGIQKSVRLSQSFSFHAYLNDLAAKPSLIGKRCLLMDRTDTDQGELTPQERALAILWQFEQACKEMKGRAVVLSDGKAGNVENLRLDELHGLRVSIVGHDGDWPISTVRFADNL